MPLAPRTPAQTRNRLLGHQGRQGLMPTKRTPKKASEGFLLVVLMLSVLLTVMSLLMARHPASGVFDPISESEASN